MKSNRKFLSICVSVSSLVALLTGCGIRHYPGQPGVVTDGYSRLNMEFLSDDGLFIYEATYDNREGGPGVKSVVTKLYPGARTFTSNVRTNSDGTKYVTKEEYKGAVVQMVYLPATNELIVPDGSKVQVILDYATSMVEIDRVNLKEVNGFGAFSSSPFTLNGVLGPEGVRRARNTWNLFRAANLRPDGSLNVVVTDISMGKFGLTLNHPIQIRTDLTQSGFQASIPQATRDQVTDFIETQYPRGYRGEVKIKVQGAEEPLSLMLGVNTPKTLKNTGVKVRTHVSRAQINSYLSQIQN